MSRPNNFQDEWMQRQTWTLDRETIETVLNDLQHLMEVKVTFPLTETIQADFILADSVQSLIKTYKHILKKLEVKAIIVNELRNSDYKKEDVKETIDTAMEAYGL
jgi:D-ribose pyranose/furanose isomerase RbsD